MAFYCYFRVKLHENCNKNGAMPTNYCAMNDAIKEIGISEIKKAYPAMGEFLLGDDLLICEITDASALEQQEMAKAFSSPLRLNGFSIFFCKSGALRADINLKSFHVRKNTLLICVPGNIVRIAPESLTDEPLSYTAILISRHLPETIKQDLNRIFRDAIRILDNPCFTLDESEIAIAREYVSMARKISDSRLGNKQEITGALLTSFTYVLIDIWNNEVASAIKDAPGTSNRTKAVFEKFIDLVTEYHTSERGMAFYAEKLCLTPKYLSKLVKQASGRSAPDWIDSFVILEAKNLLRYSDMAIKEIVFRLHFPNQSVFYKFFKSKTGLTPTQYRKGLG